MDDVRTTRREAASRRRLLLALGGGTLGVKAVPAAWLRPVVDAVVLPAHAQSSGCGGATFYVNGAEPLAANNNIAVAAAARDRPVGVMDWIVPPARAGVSGSGGGQVIEKTTFNTLTRQEIHVTVTGLDTPCDCTVINGDLEAGQNELVQQPLADLGIPSSALISSTLVDPGTTTTTHTTSYTVDATSDAVVIPGLTGDPNEDGPELLNGTKLVVSGTVTVSDTKTTISAHHAELDIVVAL
ncbi:MAG: hypothetical protein WB783_01460 [Arenicellales bacterium]